MMIVDGHCHAGPGEGFSGPADTRADLGRYLHRAREAGIERTVLLGSLRTDSARRQADVARIVRSDRRRFIGFVFVDALHDQGRVRDLVARAVRVDGFCGIKAHRIEARLTREVCEVAREFRLPVLYDVLGEVQSVRLFAPEYPDVPFIIPHLGSFADDWASQTAFVDVLASHANVYTDTAGVRFFDILVEAVRRAGPRKVIFGSDGPQLHPGVELEKIRALKLAPEDQRLVLGGNMLRLISRVRRQAPFSRLASSRCNARSVTWSCAAAF